MDDISRGDFMEQLANLVQSYNKESILLVDFNNRVGSKVVMELLEILEK